jgi:hypothetical protein
MKIDIYRCKGNRYIAVPAGGLSPIICADACYIKTIDLQTGDIRIGAGDASVILENIEKEGWSDMGSFVGA